MKSKCQCPEQAMATVPASWYEPQELKAREHTPNKCPGDYEVWLYQRDEEQLWLCSCCCLHGDKLIRRDAVNVDSD